MRLLGHLDSILQVSLPSHRHPASFLSDNQLAFFSGYGGMPVTSSPLAFPSSELGSSARRATGSRAGAGPSQLSSDGGLFRSPAVRRTQEPLFFPGSARHYFNSFKGNMLTLSMKIRTTALEAQHLDGLVEGTSIPRSPFLPLQFDLGEIKKSRSMALLSLLVHRLLLSGPTLVSPPRWMRPPSAWPVPDPMATRT